MNPERMRRYIARTTPDRIVGYFDVISGSYQHIEYEKRQWFDQFRRRMLIKHKNELGHIDLFLDNQLTYYPGQDVIVAIYRSDNA